jgi:hypothetical protein
MSPRAPVAAAIVAEIELIVAAATCCPSIVRTGTTSSRTTFAGVNSHMSLPGDVPPGYTWETLGERRVKSKGLSTKEPYRAPREVTADSTVARIKFDTPQ